MSGNERNNGGIVVVVQLVLRVVKFKLEFGVGVRIGCELVFMVKTNG